MHIKHSPLFSVIAVQFLLVVECILRNNVSDRCIHIEYNGTDSSYDVAAKECSWSDVERKINGNKDQWLELTPTIHGQHQLVTIRKVDTDSLVCITTEVNTLKTGTCNSATSIFIMNEVEDEDEDESEVFTLEHPEGSCVTIEPGRKKLSMQKCVPNDSFQQWTVCRHIGKCDVEAFWSPRGIVFRSNAVINEPTIDTSTGTSIPLKDNPDHKIVVCEILYYLQNKLTSEKSIKEQEKLISLMSSFYKEVEVDDGIHLLTFIHNETNSEEPIHHDKTDEDSARISTPEQLKLKTVFLVNLYKKLHSTKKLDNVAFVSENISRVPGHMSADLFLSFEKLLTGNVHDAISSLETVKSNFRLLLTEVLSVHNSIPNQQNPTFKNSEEFPKNDIVDIDVRLQQ